ncbi:S-layer homology domain-containing protein [Acutalibacter muris]|uniref:S-layer homology domain-containing protein n=1 Tax=Acutalibacter muris TaxID=1796620 RepID=UPI00272EAA3D|nr:S-layer homology domain-containing protein [Acutalibacter muris]
MKKLLATIGILALFLFGLAVGASASEAATQDKIIDLTNDTSPSSGPGWTWTVDGTTGTLTLNGLNMSAKPNAFEEGRPLIRFPESIKTINLVLTGNNKIIKQETFQCNIFYAKEKNVTISGTGSLAYSSEDTTSTLFYCDTLTMEGGTITIAEGSSAAYLFHTQKNLTITGGSMTFNSTYGIRSEMGPVTISGGTIELTMTNKGFGIYASPNGASDAVGVSSPAITISGGTIKTDGSISDAWFKGLSITGGSISADKEVSGNLFYKGSPETVVLPAGFATGQLSTTNAYALEIPAGRTLEVPANVRVRTNHLINDGTLNNCGRVTVNNSYAGEGKITGGGLIDFTSSYWDAVSSHVESAVLNRSATGSIDEKGYCYVYGNATWNSIWGYAPKSMYIPKDAVLTVPSSTNIQVTGAITIHSADSLNGQGTVTSAANKYYIEYSADSLTPADEMDLTYDGTNLRQQVEEQAKRKTPNQTILQKTFSLDGDNLAVGYLYGGSACPAGGGGNHYIEYNYDVGPSHRLNYRHYFTVKKLTITDDTVLEKTLNLGTSYTGSPVNFPETFLKVTHNGKNILINGNFDVAYTNNVEVGNNALITLTGKNNVEGTLTLNYTISPKNLSTKEIIIAPPEKVYDGTTAVQAKDVLSLANLDIVERDKGFVGITADVAFDTKDVVEGKNVTISNIKLTGEKAGNYVFPSYITLPSSTTGKITPAPLSVKVTGTDKPYDGSTSAQVSVEFEGLQNGETLADDDYTVTAAFDSPDAGTDKSVSGSVTLNDTDTAGNYTLESEVFQTTADITRVNLTLTAPTALAIEYGQTLADARLSGGSAENGGQTVEGTWSWAQPHTRPTESQDYPAKFAPNDTANYAVGEAQVAVSISPAQPKITITAPSRQQAGRTVPVSVRVENPYDPDFDGGLPVPTVTYKVGDGEEKQLTDGALPIPEDAVEGTVITIKASTTEVSGKYSANQSTFTITVVDKAAVTISGIVLENKTYDGRPAAYSGTPTAIDESGAPVDGLTYTYQWKDAEGNLLSEAPRDAGSYSLTVTAESDTHMGETTLPITIAKRQLAWDVSGLAASKPQTSQGEAAVYGELNLSGVINGEVTLNVTGSLTTDGLAGTKEPGNYDAAVCGTWSFDPASPRNYELPDENEPPMVSARITAVQNLETPPESTQDKQFKLEMETGISIVPAGLQGNDNLNTPAKLETAMKLEVRKTNTAIAEENTVVYDVSLLVSTDGGTNWTTATADNFPANGLTVTLPYPDGTGQNTHDFVVTHMFTTSDFGKTPGETEKPVVTKTAKGIQFKVTGLSPIAVGWVKKAGGSSGGGGWYPSVSYYDVKVEKAEHGTVSASPASASSGSTVTLTVKPDEGYKLDKITVTDSQGKAVELIEKDGKCTFKMPARSVTVQAGFVLEQTVTPSPSPKPWETPFPDVKDSEWYIKAVEFVCMNGLMSGYTNGRFGPNDTLTRAQFAQIIYNKESRPQAEGGKFSDVTTGWYADAVNWAAAEGIVAGIGGGKFAPDRPITRQDLAVMLWRYAGKPEPGKNELDFEDSNRVSGYAWKALCWASENGIVSGRGNGVLDPKRNATRAEAAQMAMKYLGERIDQE